MSVKIERIFCPIDKKIESVDNLLLPLKLANDFQAKICFCICAAEKSLEDKSLSHQKIKDLVEKSLAFLSSESSKPPIEYKTVVIETEDIVGKIVNQAAYCKTDLIVMRPSRYPSVTEFLLGSVADTICRIAPCPVLVVPPENTQNKSGEITFKRILAAHDFSDYSELALQNAVFFSEKYEAQLHLLHILAEPIYKERESAWSNESVKNLYHQTINRLQTAIIEKSGKFNQRVVAVRWGKTYKEILKYIEENEIDLVAMGAHGSDFEPRTLFGSNIDRVLRQTSSAVLIAHPRKPFYPENLRDIPLPTE